MNAPIDIYPASGNAHKVLEFRALVAALRPGVRGGVRILSAKDAGGMPPVVEDAGTFEGNARKKALALLAILPTGAWALADDSGLCVDALGGAPGVESAYYAGPQGDSAANLKKLVETMRTVPEDRRAAHFTCVLCLARPGEEVRFFEGRSQGRLEFEPRGGAGFGYDPLFVPEGYGLTFAELGEDTKNKLSHRGRAWARMAEWLEELGGD
ncbi:MAG: RdgB/HAM1 family non-canonical purine NTP pyrophosphatase [Opitutaceae bacterium]|jgi:XTP/dITP diphosphohydrolase